MVSRTILFSCDHKGCSVGWDSIIEFNSIDAARFAGWAISRDRKHCYCPKCAPKHRNVGCYGLAGWR